MGYNIMKTIKYQASTLESLILKEKAVTKEQLNDALNTKVFMTVFRKLKQLNYQTSYSHGGKYYTLEKVALYNKEGIWKYKGIYFSIYGTLIDTVYAFITKSEYGLSSHELEEMLHVQVRGVLLHLFKSERINRRKFNAVYIYFSKDSTISRKQVQIRKDRENPLDVTLGTPGVQILAHELKASIIIFFSILDERQRRLYAGLESLKLGHGGDKRIAELLGIHESTVSKGRQELLNRDIEVNRVRRIGGGRTQKKTPKK
jgi:hypothetical protein